MANRTKLTSEKEAEFLTFIAETANVTRASEKIGMSRQRMYELRDEDPDFRKRWDAAVEIGTDALEDEATRRALEGWEDPVFYQGKNVSTIRKYSDVLLIVQLKARRPGKYRENIHTEHTGSITLEGLLDKLG